MSNHKIRIGVFSDSINIPPKEGMTVHTYNMLLSIAASSELEVLLIVCDRGWLDLDILEKQPFNTLVLSSDDFYNHEKIAEIVRDYKLDILQTHTVYMTAAVLGKVSHITRKPLCVEFHDIEKMITPIYNLSSEEIAYHHELQYRAGCFSSLVRIMSSHDYDYINSIWPDLRPNILWLPPGIPAPAKVGDMNKKREGKLLLIGNMHYPPNAHAASYIVDSLAPRLPNTKFSLVGRGTEQFSGVNINAHGMVDSLDEFLQTHVIGLAPIFEGSGMKIKLLDYLSAGLPVVTTPIGASGYPKSDAIIVEEDVDKWPAILSRLLSDRADLERRSAIARKLFLDHFDLDKITHQLIKTYKQLQYDPIKTYLDFPDIQVDQDKIYWFKVINDMPRKPVTEPQYYEGVL